VVAIVSDKREFIFKAVADMYTDVARHPLKGFHFPTGRLACLFVGYPAAQLDRVPGTAVESFAGVGYPFAVGAIREGDTVLDIGSGSGTDSLIASLLAGAAGRVYGLDMAEAMLEKLRRNIASMGATNVDPLAGNAEEIPLADASVDVVTSNGVLNLVPDKPRAFGEIARVLKPGGRVQISDIALGRPLAEKARLDPKLWAECVVGAVAEDAYLDMLRGAGLTVEIVSRLDYFAGSASADTRRAAQSLGAHTIVIRGTKGESDGGWKAPAFGPSARTAATGAAGLAAAALAALASVVCWTVPLALVSLGITGAWMSTFTALAPYKGWLIAAALACLAFAGYRIYLAPPAGDDAACAAPPDARLPRALFWVVSALVLAAIASPYLVPLLLEA
jgi:SAM-dependent methyltransferase